MSYGYNNGWGGCGCGGTVQYAPPACNPNFPTSCSALGSGTIQRVVGEDSAYCKYTVPTLTSNSLLTYNASTGLVNWADGSTSNPIYLGNGNQASSSSVGSIQGTTPTGQLVEFNPSVSTETQFPIVSPSGTTTSWGTIEKIVPNQGLVYKTGSTAPTGLNPNTVYELSTSTTNVTTGTSPANVVAFDSNGNPIIVPAASLTTSSAFIDANDISITATSGTSLNVNFGQLVVTNNSGSQVVISGASGGYSLSLTSGVDNGGTLGTATTNTYYYVYAVYSASTGTISTLLSTSSTNPTVGSGYYYRLIGLFKTQNSAATADTTYFQNGSFVYLGAGSSPSYSVTGNNTASTYNNGGNPIVFIPYGVATFARLRVVYKSNGTSLNGSFAITNAASSPSIIYGSTTIAPIGNSINAYSNINAIIQVSGSAYYNVQFSGNITSNETFSIITSGYELNIF